MFQSFTLTMSAVATAKFKYHHSQGNESPWYIYKNGFINVLYRPRVVEVFWALQVFDFQYKTKDVLVKAPKQPIIGRNEFMGNACLR